jgi:hypothetical protein
VGAPVAVAVAVAVGAALSHPPAIVEDMVLTAPQSSAADHRSGRSVKRTAASGAVPGAVPGQEVLTLLREGSGRRPRFDAGLAGGMRAWLEDAAAELAHSRGEDAGPLVIGSRLLLPGDSQPVSVESGGDGLELITSVLVRALFRQVVLTGTVADPLGDALDALRVEAGRDEMVRIVDAMPGDERARLAVVLGRHTAHLLDLTPRFAPAWLPRTADRVAIPLAGGRVVLTGVFDLLVGAPTSEAASVCALGLCTGEGWAHARTTLHYLALLETLRNGTPPFRVALLHSSSGRYGVEDLREEHLNVIVSRLAQRMSEMARHV